MIRERSFRRRGRQVHLRELTDWVAWHPPRSETARTGLKSVRPPSRRGLPELQRLDQVAPDVPLSEIRAFEDAGWTFVPRSTVEAIHADIRPTNVYIESNGRLVLCANTLTVKFRDELSTSRASDFLKGYGCRVLEKMSFAPGLFRIALTDGARGDALDLAEELQHSPAIEFAEPEFIERMGTR
jgi:hypothetical protein